MRYSFIPAAILALTSSVLGQTAGFDVMASSPYQDQTVAAGSALTIKWAYNSALSNKTDTVTLTLLQGATPSTLQLGPVLGTGIDNTAEAFTYDIPSAAGSFATYGIKISLDSNPTVFQYSYPFHITAKGASTSSTSGTLNGPVSTVTMKLSTGTAYVASASSTWSSSASANVTSTFSKAATNTTMTTSASSKATGVSNSTVTSLTLTSTATKTSGSSAGASSTSSGAATKSSSAAMANMAKGSFAVIGGVVLAFAL